MAINNILKNAYGPGTFADASFTPLPAECHRLLKFFASITPGFTNNVSLLDSVEFHGGDLPIIPGPLKSQALSAVCQAMIGIVGKEICLLKDFETGNVIIDVDKSGLYPATPGLVFIDGKNLKEIQQQGILLKAGADLDKGIFHKNAMHYRSWSLYPTRDPHVWYQTLSSLNPPAFLRAYGLDPDAAVSSNNEAYELIKSEMVKYSAAELDQKNMEHGFCGQTCYTPEQWKNTTMGKSLAAHPMINYRQVVSTSDLPPVPFPKSEDKRPLAGIKVIELSRVIAGPALGTTLASLGADVIKVQSPNLPDLQALSVTLTAGKRNLALDLSVEEDKKKLQDLIQDADVIIQAFRLRSLERKGFGLNEVLQMANKRGKGVIYLDLNCYGPDGYYSERPGFQHIADAASGCSYVCGKAYGFEEGVSVLPPLPVADMLCGAVGVIDILLALRDRAKHGGSYHATVALTAIDTAQLEEEVGLYPPEIVNKIQEKYQFQPMTPELHVEELLLILMASWNQHSDILRRDGYMVTFSDTPWGNTHSILSPIIQYENSSANPRWTHGPVPYCASTDIKWT